MGQSSRSTGCVHEENLGRVGGENTQQQIVLKEQGISIQKGKAKSEGHARKSRASAATPRTYLQSTA
jgi:hypothetical protein